MLIYDSLGMILGSLSSPMDVPTTYVSLLWALPICLLISVVYKAIKLETIRVGLFVREVLLLFGTIICFLVLAAVVLWIIAWLVRH